MIFEQRNTSERGDRLELSRRRRVYIVGLSGGYGEKVGVDGQREEIKIKCCTGYDTGPRDR